MFKNVLKIEFKRGFFSLSFLFSVILIALAALSGIGNLITTARTIDYVKGSIRFIEITYQALYSEFFIFIVPITCTFGLSSSFLEDLESGLIPYYLLRTSSAKYRWGKMISCALVGASSVAMAIFLVISACFIICPINATEIVHLNLVSKSYYFYLIYRIGCLLLNGSFYALLGGVVSAFSVSRYMAYAAPFIFYYVISTLFDAYLSNQRFFNPRSWMMAGVSSGNIVIAVLISVNVIAALGFMNIMEKRMNYD